MYFYYIIINFLILRAWSEIAKNGFISKQSIYVFMVAFHYLLHIMCHFTEWNDIISLHGFEVSNQIDCIDLVEPMGLQVIF